MNIKNALSIGVICMTLCACNAKNSLSKEIEEANTYCNFILGSKLEDFPHHWKEGAYIGNGENAEAFHFKEMREDGVDVYSCGKMNTFETLFYFRDGLNVGVTTPDPEYGFSIFGKTIGYPAYGTQGNFDDGAFDALDNRGYVEDKRGPDGKAEVVMGNDPYLRFVWRRFTYADKLHVGFAYDPMYSYDGNIAIISVFLDK